MGRMITSHQRVFTVLITIVVFLLMLDLVRRRKLREEHAW
jgi:hypothetical protein